jgi:hypothetical protein
MADDCEPSLLENRNPPGRERRTQTVSTKLTPAEEVELQRASSAEGKKMAEWVRDVLLQSARRNFPSSGHEPMLLTEVVGIQLFLMNVLSPVTRGELISAEQYENIIRSVQANKGRTTRELLARRRNTEKE